MHLTMPHRQIIRSVAGVGLALLALAAAGTSHAKGHLVIVGGALKSGNAEVYRAFIDPLPETGPVVIIPAASSNPQRSAERTREDLIRHGLSAQRALTFPLALVDDESTLEEDESDWAENAWDTERVAELGTAAGFWFTGGDQARIVATLVRNGAETSPLLGLIRQRLKNGATLGGTSAGAAIMSNPMIAGGESFSALTEGRIGIGARADESEPSLQIAAGLGFLEGVLVDQHFDRRARLGRLVKAMAVTGVNAGFGIDEDTAMVVDLETRQAEVIGSGGVTLLFTSAARFSGTDALLAENVILGFAARGAGFMLDQCRLSGSLGEKTNDREYFSQPPAGAGGMAFGNQRLDQLLGHELLDNRASRQVRRYSFHEDGRMLEYRFTQTPESLGYWNDRDGESRYSVCGVRFDIRALRWSPVEQPAL